MCFRSGVPPLGCIFSFAWPSRLASVCCCHHMHSCLPFQMSSSSDVATTEFSTLYATFPNETQAHSIARNLVEERMANFINVMPTMQTVYRETNGENVMTDNEVLVMAKIRSVDAARIVDFVAEKSQVEEAEVYTVPMTHLSESLKNSLSSTLI